MENLWSAIRHFNGKLRTKIQALPSLFHNSLKALVQKFRLILRRRSPRKTGSDPAVPLANPVVPLINEDPFATQTLVVSSSPGLDPIPDQHDESITLMIPPPEEEEEELQFSENDNADVVPCESSACTVNERDHVIISIPPLEIITSKEEEIKSVVHVGAADDECRWIKHYSSGQKILLVGEGDFSFSACLAMAFGDASNMIATSLNTKAFLKENYGNALSNIQELRNRNCKVMHGIDATKMEDHQFLGPLKFDRIIFNFPHAGFFKNLERDSQLRRHRRLVSQFLKNAKEMLSENGEIHISHKTNGFHKDWKLESVASSHRLRLIEAAKFKQRDYPGYNTKYGFGGDTNFNCNPSKTFKFGLKSVTN